ncbi:MAG: peptidase U32 family protein, partial [Butyricicoccus sp.]
MNRPELLAPAGSFEGVRAAVQSGADAVYLGFGTFNARRGAKNFTREEMAEAIRYCRARGVKTNVTFNILALDRELEAAMEDVRFLNEAGADALIVQDLGVARLIREHAPDLPLHASTQMTIHNLDGALAAKELGFSRVVLSRECTLEQIREITAKAGVETEVFVHGALCMCYSGQCYLSSVIGRRSGNRGLCAQPCRLPYGYDGGKKRYPLSLKDLSAADLVAELTRAGVSSLKIEGRMKRPEYAAAVTAVYAKLLREQRAANAEEHALLRRVFSRDGFTDGYLTGKRDAAMFGT